MFSSPDGVSPNWMQREGDRKETSPAYRETFQTWTISIACSHRSNERKASSTWCSRMPVSRKTAPLGKITEEQYDSLFDGNVKGVLFTIQKALPLYAGRCVDHPECVCRRQQGDFQIGACIALQKLLCVRLPRTWTTDLKARRIRVNAVSPGLHRHSPLACQRRGRAAH